MKKERISFILMLFSIFFFSACSDKEEIDNSFKITVTPPTLMLKVGETAFITVNDVPEGADVIWKSSDEKVAKVNTIDTIKNIRKALIFFWNSSINIHF